MYVGCKYNLALEVTKAGGLKLNVLSENCTSCALDYAESGASVGEVATLLGTSQEHVRQVERSALLKLQSSQELREHLSEL